MSLWRGGWGGGGELVPSLGGDTCRDVNVRWVCLRNVESTRHLCIQLIQLREAARASSDLDDIKVHSLHEKPQTINQLQENDHKRFSLSNSEPKRLKE